MEVSPGKGIREDAYANAHCGPWRRFAFNQRVDLRFSLALLLRLPDCDATFVLLFESSFEIVNTGLPTNFPHQRGKSAQ